MDAAGLGEEIVLRYKRGDIPLSYLKSGQNGILPPLVKKKTLIEPT